MTEKKESEQTQEYALLQSRFLIIMVAISITSAIGVFSASAFLFSQPGVLSGIIFGLCIIFLVILPLVLLTVYYNKKMKPLKIENEKQIILLNKSEKQGASRIDLLD